MPPIVFVLGSDSDLPQLEGAFKILRGLDVAFGVRILSAHRTPTETAAFADNADRDGVRVIIAAAGMAAALPGVIAAHTTLPVLGVPMDSSSLQGVDALYSIAQMPGGVPVGCMGIGSAGAKNAALFAVRLLALDAPELRQRLHDFVGAQADNVRRKDAEVQQRFATE